MTMSRRPASNKDLPTKEVGALPIELHRAVMSPRPDSNEELSNFRKTLSQLSYTGDLIIGVTGNRTPIKGFGGLRSAIKL
jgi:hypothetical protein